MKKIGILSKFWDEHYEKAGQGIKEASKELGVFIDYQGPKALNVLEQIKIIEKWIKKKFDAIIISANDPDALVPVMKEAQQVGIKTATWSSDISAGREYFLNQTSYKKMGECIVDMMVKSLKEPEGNFLVVTSSYKSPNQSKWLNAMKLYSHTKYPKIIYKDILSSEGSSTLAIKYTHQYLKNNSSTKGIFSLSGDATPQIIDVLKKLKLIDKIAITGIGVPPQITTFLKEGSIKQVALWKPENLGYGAVHLAKKLIEGNITKHQKSINLGRLGTLKIENNNTIILGEPHIITYKKDTRDFLQFIDNSLSGIKTENDIINFFTQTACHNIMSLIVMKSYYEDTELSKQNLLESVHDFTKSFQKKTLTTESKYLEIAIAKGYLNQNTSPSDHRKILIGPSERMILLLENYFIKLTDRIDSKNYKI
mgnify:CR=1 FL=1